MPAVEIADSIVQSGRETLEKVRGAWALPLRSNLTLVGCSGDPVHRLE